MRDCDANGCIHFISRVIMPLYRCIKRNEVCRAAKAAVNLILAQITGTAGLLPDEMGNLLAYKVRPAAAPPAWELFELPAPPTSLADWDDVEAPSSSSSSSTMSAAPSSPSLFARLRGRRRHHCRQCGILVCADCSAHRAHVRGLRPGLVSVQSMGGREEEQSNEF